MLLNILPLPHERARKSVAALHTFMCKQTGEEAAALAHGSSLPAARLRPIVQLWSTKTTARLQRNTRAVSVSVHGAADWRHCGL